MSVVYVPISVKITGVRPQVPYHRQSLVLTNMNYIMDGLLYISSYFCISLNICFIDKYKNHTFTSRP